MLANLRAFVRTTLFGGIAVLLPLALFVAVYAWVYRFLTGLIEPISEEVLNFSQLTERILADAIAIALLIAVCFFVGLLVRTNMGLIIQSTIDQRLLRRFPGYTIIKETIGQFFGDKKKLPFSSVALVQPFGNDTYMTAFVTEVHDNGRTTVYVPASPSPVAGNVYHLLNKFVHPLDVSVEKAMRSILSCGAGASELWARYEAAQIDRLTGGDDAADA